MYEFLTRSGCPLCDEARSLVMDEVKRKGASVREIDIDLDEDLTAEFGMRVPVLRISGGQVIAEGRIERRSLRKGLRSTRRR